ncbi:hypothetical protein CASFOL_005936 [Castilleja foliolosa]|uniref:Uncharacterized protein n=1 Tax=Castilleja foliolosa TaxID=1961234 RepID=A0ABD3E596_9LAMI
METPPPSNLGAATVLTSQNLAEAAVSAPPLTSQSAEMIVDVDHRLAPPAVANQYDLPLAVSGPQLVQFIDVDLDLPLAVAVSGPQLVQILDMDLDLRLAPPPTAALTSAALTLPRRRRQAEPPLEPQPRRPRYEPHVQSDALRLAPSAFPPVR